MHFGYAWAVVKRSIIGLIVVSLVGAVSGMGWYLLTHKYTVSAYLMLLPAEKQLATRAANPERFLQTTIQTMLADEVLNRAVEALHEPGLTTGKLRQSIAVTGGTQSDIVEVTAKSDTPERSHDRAAAVVAAISTVSADEFTTRLLWVGAPTATLSGLVAVAGGAAGFGLLGLVILLIWASNRRPLLDPSYLELTSPRTDIYPETLVIGDRRYHLLRTGLANWLGSEPPTQIQVVPPRPWVAALETELANTSSQGETQPRRQADTAVVLALIGSATEDAINRTARRLAFHNDQVIVVAVDRLSQAHYSGGAK